MLFHEYFHSDTSRGVGASHQTGWTGLVAKLLQPRRGPGQSSDTLFLARPARPQRGFKKSKEPLQHGKTGVSEFLTSP